MLPDHYLLVYTSRKTTICVAWKAKRRKNIFYVACYKECDAKHHSISTRYELYASHVGVCKNIRSKISDPKIRRSEISDIRSDFKISDISDRVSGKNFGFSDRIRIGIFQKFQRTWSENPVIRSEKFGYPKISDRIRISISPIRSNIQHWTPLVAPYQCATHIAHVRRTLRPIRRTSLHSCDKIFEALSASHITNVRCKTLIYVEPLCPSDADKPN